MTTHEQGAMTGAQFLEAMLDAGFGGWKQRDIAERLGTSQSRICQWSKKGIGPLCRTSPEQVMAMLHEHGPAYQGQVYRPMLRTWRADGADDGRQLAAGESLSIHTPEAVRALQDEQRELDSSPGDIVHLTDPATDTNDVAAQIALLTAVLGGRLAAVLAHREAADADPHPDVLHHSRFVCWRTAGVFAVPCIGPRCSAWTETDRAEPAGFCAALAALQRDRDDAPDYALFPVMVRDPYPDENEA